MFQDFSYNVNQHKESPFTTINPVLPPITSQKYDELDVGVNNTTFNVDLDFTSLKSRFRELQEEHKKLIAVTAELTNALQLNIMGQTRNMHHVLNQCKTIYPSLFVSQNKHQQSVSGETNIRTSFSHTAKNEQVIPTTNHTENLLESQETASEDNLRSTFNKEPNKDLLNLDIGHIENEEEQLYTPVSEKEIKDILEIILNKAIHYLSEGDRNGESKCCDIGKACEACRKEISKIVESILVKVMESPRYKISPRYYNNCSTTLMESNQYQVQIPNKLPQKLRDGLTTAGDDNDNKVQYEEFMKSFSNKDTNFNYGVVKNDLLKLDNEKILCILQVLRWRLTKSKVAERNRTLDDYVQYDILNLHEKHLWPELLSQRNCAHVNEYLIRVLNAIASLQKGRNYLGSNDKLLKSVLLPQFMNSHMNSTTNESDMLIATLQKLSLQKHMRIQMVNEGLLEYLIKFLDKLYNKLSLYSLEHCTALLMNLCSVDDAKKYCANNADKVINLMKKFLAEQHTSSLPYVNGTLLSLLVHEDIYFEAKKQRLDQVIQQLVKNIKDEYLRQQLIFILYSRFSGQLHSFIGDEDERVQDPDVLESELDTESEEVNLNDTAKMDYRKSDEQGMLKSELDSTKMQNLPRNGTDYISSSTGVVYMPDDQKNVKTSSAHSNKRKRVLRRIRNFPSSSFCYLEICHGVQEGTTNCGCTRCVPGKSKYSCGCYDLICREIAEEIDNAICKGQTINRTKYVKKTFREGSIEVIESTKKENGSCAICGDKVCNCAFESRPKIHRTPPKT